MLDGQVNLLPRAETTTIAGKGGSGKLRTKVPVIPDAPIGHFRLTVFGGKTGYLTHTRDICARAPVTKIDYVAQSGRTYSQKAKVGADGCGKRSPRRSSN